MAALFGGRLLFGIEIVKFVLSSQLGMSLLRKEPTMRYYLLKNVHQVVYEPGDQVPKKIKQVLVQNWRTAHKGDWVLADDGCVMRVLREGKISKERYLGTITGTFVVRDNLHMDGNRRDDIYSIGGRLPSQRRLLRKRCTNQEMLFAKYIAAGMEPSRAYMQAFSTRRYMYAKGEAKMLLSTNRIQDQISAEVKSVCAKLGITIESSILGIHEIAQSGEIKSGVRLRALLNLLALQGVSVRSGEHQQPVSSQGPTQINNYFSGFSNAQLNEIDSDKENTKERPPQAATPLIESKITKVEIEGVSEASRTLDTLGEEPIKNPEGSPESADEVDITFIGEEEELPQPAEPQIVVDTVPLEPPVTRLPVFNPKGLGRNMDPSKFARE